MVRLMKQKDAIQELIAHFLTNQIAEFASDFKMDIIKPLFECPE